MEERQAEAERLQIPRSKVGRGVGEAGGDAGPSTAWFAKCANHFAQDDTVMGGGWSLDEELEIAFELGYGFGGRGES